MPRTLNKGMTGGRIRKILAAGRSAFGGFGAVQHLAGGPPASITVRRWASSVPVKAIPSQLSPGQSSFRPIRNVPDYTDMQAAFSTTERYANSRSAKDLYKSRWWDLNPQPPLYESGALPLSYIGGGEIAEL